MTTPANQPNGTASKPPESKAPPMVGQDGCPIRAFAFSSGGIETAMHLGVAHALLVIQGKPPDAAVGISAGAISAASIAEILQAGADLPPAPGETADRDERVAHRSRVLEARVKRFREVFDGYQRAPAELIEAALPDPLQLNARRPLEPLLLPIHHSWERKGRQDSLQSRAGLINLYNQLLELRMPWSTITRAIRRGLGIEAAPELRPHWKSILATVGEIGRAWILLGFHLLMVAPLLPSLARPWFRTKPAKVHGETAATVIFQSWFLRATRRMAGISLSFLGLAAFWFGLSFVPWVMAYGIVWGAEKLGWSPATVPAWFHDYRAELALGLPLAVFVCALIAGIWYRPLLTAARRLVIELFDFLLLLAVGLAVIWIGVVAGLTAASIQGTQVRTALEEAVRHSGQPTAIVVAALAAFAIVCLVVLGLTVPKDYTRRLLAGYDLADSLFSEHPLRQLLIQVLDPGYYGTDLMDDIVERALQDDKSPSEVTLAGKLIGDYTGKPACRPIHLGLGVADVASGTLTTLEPHVKVVDGLLAASAITPLLPPQAMDGKLYVDGANISTEATQLALNFLRPRVNPKSTVLHVYTVVPLPFSRGAVGGPDKPYLTLIEVAARAVQLARFRDASMERRITELFTTIIPPATGVRLKTAGGHDYLRAWVTAIEPERPLELGRHLIAASDKSKRRDLIARTVADGCRAALEVMIRPSLGALPQPPDPAVARKCRKAVQEHLATRVAVSGRALPGMELPGSDPSPDAGPGLVEVCSHCALQASFDQPDADRTERQSIRVHPWTTMGPAWPHELEEECEPTQRDPHFSRAPSRYEEQTEQALTGLAKAIEKGGVPETGQWPRHRRDMPGAERPLVSLLFSGGVFRGVYQMGVLTALSEADVQPDIIAGASVGSITAALVAESFSQSRGASRDGRLARLAATYLALDRLVLTDRFADFIRNFTLRAAATGFSLRQADRFFRRYDSANASTFDREARLVLAGIERLFYVSPFELKELVKALRDQDMPRATQLLHRYLQEWLDRMGTGNQILGAEPLALVITEHVLCQLAPGGAPNTPVPFDAFLAQRGIYFLATATNLTQGRLEVLGEQQLVGGRHQAMLLEGLLASSAFPAVFRPRWAWEVMPGTSTRDQYMDGGVMDNLPLDAVAQFLFQAARGHLVAPRPVVNGKSVPHLLFSASLEIHQPVLTTAEVSRLQADWVSLSRRAKALKYNKKLEGYAVAQRAVRDIWAAVGQPGGNSTDPQLVPLDLEVATVIPRWLCGTFAFHPMLGFRRTRQAESIAHGCASTLIALGKIVDDHADWAAGWGIDACEVPGASYVKREDPYEALKDDSAPKHRCWLRPQIDCPFSRARVEKTGLASQTVIELENIHLACRRQKTHQSR
ncbi:MAG: patatin-like phospholipase family protein [Gemmatimonadales bacterium]